MGYENGELSLYSLKRQKFLGELEAHETRVISADILETSSQSLFLTTVSQDKEVKVHDLLLRDSLKSLPEHLSSVVSAKFLNFSGKQDFVSAFKGWSIV